MATWNIVTKVALALPEAVEQRSKHGLLGWSVKDKTFAWERPLRRSDLLALGDRAPKGDVLAAYVPDLETKDAMVNARGEVFFTTPHFDGYAMILIELSKISVNELREVLSEAWRVRAPRRLVDEREGGPSRKTKAPPKAKAKAKTTATTSKKKATAPAKR